jgi:hypothetical protein
MFDNDLGTCKMINNWSNLTALNVQWCVVKVAKCKQSTHEVFWLP